MATAKPHRFGRPPHQAGSRRHRLRNALLAVVVVAVLGIAMSWHFITAQAVLATSYGARIACTCHYIEGRALQDCRKDFEPGMGLVVLRDNAPAHSITARVPVVAEQTAAFHEGAGCLLQNWAP